MPGYGCGFIPYCNAKPVIYPNPGFAPVPNQTTLISNNTRNSTSQKVVTPTQNRIPHFAAAP